MNIIIKNIGKSNLKFIRNKDNYVPSGFDTSNLIRQFDHYGVPKDRFLINRGDKKIVIKDGFVIGGKKVLMNPTEEIWLLPGEMIDFTFDKVIDRYRANNKKGRRQLLCEEVILKP